ncbi:hypothetical protein PCYB_004950 [Plasmodium cynomolgi strain B]|uniref:CYIR protein n=1 Tax=Plasmodium cynomolgi (strain B) TaxID=1120755 RepID=K6UFA2_PLACD|nr:hypothetical protein PCYB_004950 [Plasmodium cynomolgi strain B]GAB69746.1 hypothetical protein PCYB_004950 [Plasmodium cynomolgi strain B]
METEDLQDYDTICSRITVKEDVDKNIYEKVNNTLQVLWNDVVKEQRDKFHNNICKPDHTTIGRIDWRKRKELHDYYVDYGYLFDMAKINNDKCKEYYGKIKKIIEEYESFEKKCSTRTDECPEFIYELQKKIKQNKPENLPCHEEINSNSVPILEGNSSLQIKGHTEVHQKPEDDIELDIIDNLTFESDNQLGSGSSGIGTKVTHSILGGAPVLLTATMLYRVCRYFVNLYYYSTNV